MYDCVRVLLFWCFRSEAFTVICSCFVSVMEVYCSSVFFGFRDFSVCYLGHLSVLSFFVQRFVLFFVQLTDFAICTQKRNDSSKELRIIFSMCYILMITFQPEGILMMVVAVAVRWRL